MGCQSVGTKLNTLDIIRAFQYFSTSHSLYKKLRNGYELPSVQTMTKIISKVAKLSESQFCTYQSSVVWRIGRNCVWCYTMKCIWKKWCGTMGVKSLEEVWTTPNPWPKPCLVSWLTVSLGDPLLTKMLPVSNLLSNLLHDQVGLSVECIQKAGGKSHTAKWQHLQDLFRLEQDSLTQMSNLNEVAVLPKPIEKQKVKYLLHYHYYFLSIPHSNPRVHYAFGLFRLTSFWGKFLGNMSLDVKNW